MRVSGKEHSGRKVMGTEALGVGLAFRATAGHSHCRSP